MYTAHETSPAGETKERVYRIYAERLHKPFSHYRMAKNLPTTSIPTGKRLITYGFPIHKPFSLGTKSIFRVKIGVSGFKFHWKISAMVDLLITQCWYRYMARCRTGCKSLSEETNNTSSNTAKHCATMHISTRHHTMLHMTTLHHTVLHYPTQHHTVLHYSTTLPRAILHHITLQRTMVH